MDLRSSEADMDEYHHKATRTLFVGNLEKDISSSQLRDSFAPFGKILVSGAPVPPPVRARHHTIYPRLQDIEIKRQGSVGSQAFAFVQYDDIKSVVRALRKMNEEVVGQNKVKVSVARTITNAHSVGFSSGSERACRPRRCGWTGSRKTRR